MRFLPPFSCSALVSLALAAPVLAATPPQGPTADFLELDSVEGEVGFNPVPRRPMALSSDQLHLYAVNTHNSTVLEFTDATGVPANVFHVPKSPVSIAVWDDESTPADPEKLVVVCDGTYALVVLDRSSGKILRLLELRDPTTGRIMGEPADLLVDDGTSNMAFVSCAAGDAVLQVDLVAGTIVSKFDLPAKDPVFMCFDGTSAKNVLVAPMFSGNNSGARQLADSIEFFAGQHHGPTVVDFATQGLNGTRLPDRDLFRCVRVSPPTPLGTVQAVTTGMGTVLFACGVHPGTGKIWQLNTEANNKDSANQTEASIRGNIVQNRLSIAVDPGLGQPPVGPTSIKDLDLTNPNLPYDPTRTVGQPYGLSFAGSFGLITGLLTDNLMIVGSGGAFLGEKDLPAGSIPRATLYSATFGQVYVYCWGTSKIEVVRLSDLVTLATLDLGYDPTPADVKDGRRIFYDAANSLHNNASCASCHVDGRTDMIVWNLSKGVIDDKGPMVTQTLAGIEKLVPFHWRGEQQLGLIDFNPAFPNLLGAPAPLSSADFAKFERFVFSIQNRPNPFGNEDRKVDSTIQPPRFAFAPIDGNAINGQTLFAASCESCHQFPLGTSNDIVGDGTLEDEQNPRRQFFKVGPFHDLYKKEQDADKTPDVNGDNWVDTVTITLAALSGSGQDTAQYPLLGAGLSHAGLLTNLDEFVASFKGFSQQQIADIAAFIIQWDQGVGPAAYGGVLLDPNSPSSVARVNQLVAQANTRNCDLAVFGSSTIGGVPTAMRWVHDRTLVGAQFVSEDHPLVETLAFFLGQAPGSNVFIGLPVGSGRRFAIDFDGDDFLNADEIAVGNDPYDPFDPPPVSDLVDPGVSAEFVMASSRVARVNVETDEPCTLTVTYTKQGGGTPQTKSTSDFARTHSVVLNDLVRNSTYDVTVEAHDRGGNDASDSLTVTTRTGNGAANIRVIGDLAWTNIQRGLTPGGLRTLTATATVRVDKKTTGTPIQNARVIARVFVDDVLYASFNPVGSSKKVADFDFQTATTPPTLVDFTGLSGPFLVSPLTDVNGRATLRFNVVGPPLGAKITLNVELVAPELTPPPAFAVTSIFDWNMPSTPAAFRSLSTDM